MLHEGSRSSPRNLQINSVENYITFDVVNLLEQVRSMPGARPLKAIILGCTHFPFYEDAFRKQLERLSRYQEKGEYIYRSVIDPRVVLIDPAVRVAEELYSLLGERRMFADSALSNSEFYISVPNRRNPGVELDEEGFFTYKYKYTRRVNSGQEYVRIVPFSRRTVPEAVLERLGQTVPAIQNLVTEFHRHNGKLRSLPDSDRIK